MKAMLMCLLGVFMLAASPVFADFNVGDRVECNWKGGGKYYSGTVAAKEAGKIFIQYDDGDKEHTYPDMCYAKGGSSGRGGMAVGSNVECRWKNGRTWYPGVIAEKTGTRVFIHYNDGDKEHTTLNKCRPR